MTIDKSTKLAARPFDLELDSIVPAIPCLPPGQQMSRKFSIMFNRAVQAHESVGSVIQMLRHSVDICPLA